MHGVLLNLEPLQPCWSLQIAHGHGCSELFKCFRGSAGGPTHCTFALVSKGNNNSKDKVSAGFNLAFHKQSYTPECVLRLYHVLHHFSLLLLIWCSWRLKSLSTHAANLGHVCWMLAGNQMYLYSNGDWKRKIHYFRIKGSVNCR